ncbi:uncharacterized protein LOC143017760 isoform X2 [Oratosquilla oratoria]|uniref:uncharacterized protein LOC143017760 isoform X2 n=1 Tax=Oratosquilla oratoria TaxID=337810 RepID=UPI003F75A1EF
MSRRRSHLSLERVSKTDMASNTSQSGTGQMVFQLSSDDDGCATETVTTHTKTADYSVTTTTKRKTRRNETPSSMIIAADIPRAANNPNNGGTVVFSIQFYGKTFGEVGILDQDLVQLDWAKFKSYLFQNVLSSGVQQEDICVYYRDEEGDKLPIDSEAEYQEAVKVAKRKAAMNEKLLLDITRQGTSPTSTSPSTVLSLVSSGIRRVGSSPPKDGSGISFFRPMSSSSSSSSSTSLTPKDHQGRGPRNISERKFFPCLFVADNKVCRRKQSRSRFLHLPNFLSPGSSHESWNGSPESQGLNGSFNRSTSPGGTSTTQAQNIPIHRSRSHHNYLHFRARDSPPVPFLYQASPSPKTTKDSKGGTFSTHSHMQGQEDTKKQEEEGKNDSENLPPSWFITYMRKFHEELRAEIHEDIATTLQNLVHFGGPSTVQESASHSSQKGGNISALKSKEFVKDLELSNGVKVKSREKLKKKEKPCCYSELSAKRKKTMNKEEDKPKKTDRPEKRKSSSKHGEDRDKCMRGQEKILAKMADLRRKSWCSAEQLNQLRKVMHKQHRLVAAEARHHRRCERKSMRSSSSKMGKMSTEPLELETLAEDLSGERRHGPGYNAQFLHDITFPDGSTVEAGKTFVKTWRVRNNGLFPWNDRTMLCKWQRVRLPGTPAGWKLIPSTKKVPCPKLKPGEEGSISVSFTAPDQPGWYATHWQFCQSGRVFGNQMWCAVCVVKKESDEQDEVEENQRKEWECGSDVAASLSDSTQPKEAEEPHVDPNSHKGGKLDSLFKSSGLTRDVFCTVQEGLSTQPSEELGNTVVLVEDYFQIDIPVQPAIEVTEGIKRLSICSEHIVADSCTGTVECKEKEEHEDKEPQMAVEPGCGRTSFEEEAELVARSVCFETTKDLHDISLELPHKEMEESTLSLDDAVLVMQSDENETKNALVEHLNIDSSDSISISSGTFSEVDSEDQAILRESDSDDASDREFCMVKMPECFNFKTETTAMKRRSKHCEKSPDFCKVELPLPINNSSESETNSRDVENPSPTLISVSMDGDSGWSSCMTSEKQPVVKGSSSTSTRVPYTTGALPDELVQDIPEDSVRGAWNTACTFISRINQEMLSPTESPKDTGEHCVKSDPVEGKPEGGESEQGAAAKPVTMITEPHLYTETDPLQQLVSMGFTNLHVNQRLLRKYDGDVAKVIADLVVFNTL